MVELENERDDKENKYVYIDVMSPFLLPHSLVLRFVVTHEVNDRLNRVRALLDAASTVGGKLLSQLLDLHKGDANDRTSFTTGIGRPVTVGGFHFWIRCVLHVVICKPI